MEFGPGVFLFDAFGDVFEDFFPAALAFRGIVELACVVVGIHEVEGAVVADDANEVVDELFEVVEVIALVVHDAVVVEEDESGFVRCDVGVVGHALAVHESGVVEVGQFVARHFE